MTLALWIAAWVAAALLVALILGHVLRRRDERAGITRAQNDADQARWLKRKLP